MNIKITSVNLELTPAIHEYLNKRFVTLQKFVDAYDSNALCEVELGKTTMHHKSGDLFRTEINLTIKGELIYVVAETEDLYASIDKVKDEAVSAVKSYKGKRETLYRRGKSAIKNIIKGLGRNGN